MQTNLQLLAGCYLQSNQAYCAYHILKGIFLPYLVIYVSVSFEAVLLFLNIISPPFLSPVFN